MNPDRGWSPPVIAYFSMEIALDDAIPTYSGGLGVLAGDHLRAAADAGLPMVGVTLLYHKGYFSQRVDRRGVQSERAERWSPAAVLERLPQRVEVEVAGRQVRVGVWRKVVAGQAGHRVPVYFLDTRQAGNDPAARAITDELYGGDAEVRLSQELVLGLGGVAMLGELGHSVGTFHMNEGHSALLAVALGGPGTEGAARSEVGSRCVFTTHTPVPAGHDRFDRALVEQLVPDEQCRRLDHLGLLDRGELDMTELGLAAARWCNAVSVRHRAVSRAMFPGRDVQVVTNGVHAQTWVAEPMARLLDRRVPTWRQDNAALRYVLSAPLEEVQEAHTEAKRAMVEEVARHTRTRLDPTALTLGVARRATAYKRTDLVLSDPERLRSLVDRVGPLQVVFAGKAHPQDKRGKELIHRIVQAGHALRDAVTVVFLDGYSMATARLLCAGADVWLNTPVRTREASGTSGMKAALNGVPSLSVLDGWWIEGHWEGVTGWSVGDEPRWEDVQELEPGDGDHGSSDVADPVVDAADAASLYDKLETVVAPCFYQEPQQFAAVMRNAVALNGGFFTAERMVREYAATAYATWAGDDAGPGAGTDAGTGAGTGMSQAAGASGPR